jgi:hypothetical protein
MCGWCSEIQVMGSEQQIWFWASQRAHLLDAAIGRSGRLAVGAEGEGKCPAGKLHGMQQSGLECPSGGRARMNCIGAGVIGRVHGLQHRNLHAKRMLWRALSS